MRGTTKITQSNSLYYIKRNYRNLAKVNEQIASQKQVPSLESDPLAANLGIRLSGVMARITQYDKNIQTGLGTLTLLDQYLGSCKTEMDEIKNKVVQGANEVTTSEQRKTLAAELNVILQQLVNAADSRDGMRYLFGGYNTTTPPFTIVNGRYVNYAGDDENILLSVDYDSSQAINCTGSAAFGSMVTTIGGRDYNPDVNLGTDTSTKLSDLNGGDGVPKGKIMVYYSSYPQGLEVDLSGCDTLEDVKDRIEAETLAASRALNPADHRWLDGTNLDWRDLQDRYVAVSLNPEHNGISLQEFDLGETLPSPTQYEASRGVDYTGVPGYPSGGGGIGGGPGAVYDKADYVYGDGSGRYAPLRVDDVAGNQVATSLGIKGSATVYDPAQPDPVLDGFLHGRDLDPVLSDRTLLADLEGYNDSSYSLYNGSLPGDLVFKETSDDIMNVFSNWDLTSLSKGDNTGPNGELYARVTRRGTAPNDELYLEIYSKPINKAKSSDLVATGTYTQSSDGGTFVVREANASGIGGTVGVHLPLSVDESSVALEVDFGQTLHASVHVPAFTEEYNADGSPRDRFNIASGWQIRGLIKPPAIGYNENKPASTDLDGNVSVNYRYDGSIPGQEKFVIELYRPSFNGQPAALIATGSMNINLPQIDANGDPAVVPLDLPTAFANSGRVELVGAPGFEDVKGSVYIELPTGTDFVANPALGTGANDPTAVTYALQNDAPAGAVYLNGATELPIAHGVAGPMTLAGDTLFKAGQQFVDDVYLPDGTRIPAGMPLPHDMVMPRGVVVNAASFDAGTVLAAGQVVNFSNAVAAGTVVPRGSYYVGGPGFGADGMTMTVADPTANPPDAVTASPAGYDLTATFATVEDFNRAVRESGVYVMSRVADDGRSLEFASTLSGAYLTVSEDTDCYEQMGDEYRQLSALDLGGLIKGVNADSYGNVYTEVIYYPPNPNHPENKVQLLADDGTVYELDPGYYVRVYSDPDEMEKSYENRDNTKMVAEGFLPAGAWRTPPDWDPSQPISSTNYPFDPIPPATAVGMATGLVLAERNGSGVTGIVNLNYYGGRTQAEERTRIDKNGNPETYIEYDPWSNDGITVFPGGLRPEGGRHVTIQEWDMNSVVPGKTCDYGGTYHGRIRRDDSLLNNVQNKTAIQVELYKDSSNKVMTAKNDVAEEIGADGKVRLYETNPDGSFRLDNNGQKIPAGTMTVEHSRLVDGADDDFVLTTGASRHSAQEREQNVFSTINDILDALNADDVGALHDLLGTIQADIDRILDARTDVAARTDHLNLMTERHADELLNYNSVIVKRVGMDTDTLAAAIVNYQSAMNAFEAALQTSGTILQLSLLDYL